MLANGAGARLSSYKNVIGCLLDRFSFISWDYRGLFDSGRPVRGYDGLRMADHARDALCVLDHFDLKTPHVMGWSMGVQVLLEAHRLRADYCRSMVLIGGVSGHPYETFFGTAAFSTVLPGLFRTGQSLDSLVAWVLPRLTSAPWLVTALVRAGLLHHDIDRDAFADAARNFADLDVHVFCEIMLELGRHDASEELAHIRCPTLLLTGSKDMFTPLERARDITAHMPDARFVLIPGATHYAPLEMPDLVCDALANFYAGRGATSSPAVAHGPAAG